MQPNRVSIYAEAMSKRVDNIMGAKAIIQLDLTQSETYGYDNPQLIPSSVFWNGEYELVHP